MRWYVISVEVCDVLSNELNEMLLFQANRGQKGFTRHQMSFACHKLCIAATVGISHDSSQP